MAKRLQTPEIHVFMLDGAEYDVRAVHADMVAYDNVRATHPKKFPDPQQGPMTWMGFLAWHALAKTQKIMPTMTYDEFVAACEGVTSATYDNEDDAPGVDPTQPEAEGD